MTWVFSFYNYFSLTQWAQDQRDLSWVYLIVRDRDLAATKPLLRLWFDLATLGILQREENLNYPHLWLIADELTGLGKLPSLGKLLSQGRKYQGTVIAGYQTAAQIHDTYGREAAGEILQGFQNKLIFRCADPDTARHSSLELGEQDVIEVVKNIQFGRLAESDRNSLNQNLKTKPAVSASEILNLPDLTAYIKICHFNPCITHFDYHRYEEVNRPTECEIPSIQIKNQQNNDFEPESYTEDVNIDEQDNAEQERENKQTNNQPIVQDDEPDYDFDPDNFLNF